MSQQSQYELAPLLGLLGSQYLADTGSKRLGRAYASKLDDPRFLDSSDVVHRLVNRSGLDLGVESAERLAPQGGPLYGYEPAKVLGRTNVSNMAELGPIKDVHGRVLKLVEPGGSSRFNVPVAAHEIGHALARHGPNKFQRAVTGLNDAAIVSKLKWLAPILGLLGVAGVNADNRDTKRKLLNAASIAGGVVSAPMLADEAIASYNALKMLKSLPPEEAAKFMRPARRILGRGLGTYGLGAAAVIGVPQVAKQFISKEASWLGTAGRVALGSLPVLGAGYEGLQAYKAFRQGRWGSGLGHAALAGLSAIPGVGILGGLGKGVGKALFRGAGATGAKGLARVGEGFQAAGAGLERGVGRLMSSPGRIGTGLRATQGGPGSLAQIGGSVGLGTMDANYAAGRQAFNQSVNSGASGLKSLGSFAQSRGIQNPMFASPNNSLGGIPGMLGAY